MLVDFLYLDGCQIAIGILRVGGCVVERVVGRVVDFVPCKLSGKLSRHVTQLVDDGSGSSQIVYIEGESEAATIEEEQGCGKGITLG